jgi:hypothetical protein
VGFIAGSITSTAYSSCLKKELPSLRQYDLKQGDEVLDSSRKEGGIDAGFITKKIIETEYAKTDTIPKGNVIYFSLRPNGAKNQAGIIIMKDTLAVKGYVMKDLVGNKPLFFLNVIVSVVRKGGKVNITNLNSLVSGMAMSSKFYHYKQISSSHIVNRNKIKFQIAGKYAYASKKYINDNKHHRKVTSVGMKSVVLVIKGVIDIRSKQGTLKIIKP